MNINIRLRIDPTKYGKSGTLAVCVYCGKATVWQICCDEIDGLLPISKDNLQAIAGEYCFTQNQIDNLEQAVSDFAAGDIVSILFYDAVNAYKAWWDCGRNHATHQRIFDVWLSAVEAYRSEAGISRNLAVDKVREILGMSNTL